jgi:hypothetical protein
MPVSYTIDTERGRIATYCGDVTTLREVLSHFDELEMDPDCPVGADVLLDLTDMRSLPNLTEMHSAAARACVAAGRVRFGSCAIVVGSEGMFGMARVFEVFAERSFPRISVFRSRDAAEEWLETRCAN